MGSTRGHDQRLRRGQLTNAHTALRPGGRLFVIDMRLIQSGWSAPLIWLGQELYRGLAGGSGVDVLDTARSVFATGTVTAPNFPGERRASRSSTGWPPLTAFVATKAARPE